MRPLTDSWQTVNGHSIGRSTRSGVRYRRVAATFPYQSLGQRGGTVQPDAWIIYRTRLSDTDDTYDYVLARYLGRVSADAGVDVTPFRGLAVIALSSQGTGAYERWISPRDIVRVIGDWPAIVASAAAAPIHWQEDK